MNVLKPYPHWAEFRKFILTVLTTYQSVADHRGIRTVTLRYIDLIDPGGGSVVLGDWLDESHYFPAFLRDATTPAQSRVQKEVDGGLLTVAVRLQPRPESTPVIMLDTAALRSGPPIDVDGLGQVLDAMHEQIIDVFESCRVFHRLSVTLVADEGQDQQVSATVLACSDWPGPVVIGYMGFLERVRVALDPGQDHGQQWFYFGPVS